MLNNLSTSAVPEDTLAQRFQHEVLPMYNVLFMRAMQLTRNRADAEDLVQDTLMRAFKGFDKFEPGTNLRAWLYRIMRNGWINGYRRAERRPVEELHGNVADRLLASDAPPPTGADHRSAEDIIISQMQDGAISAALAALSPALRETLYHRHISDCTYQEIANFMNVPVGTVMSRLHRGHRHLRGRLTGTAAAS